MRVETLGEGGIPIFAFMLSPLSLTIQNKEITVEKDNDFFVIELDNGTLKIPV